MKETLLPFIVIVGLQGVDSLGNYHFKGIHEKDTIIYVTTEMTPPDTVRLIKPIHQLPENK